MPADIIFTSAFNLRHSLGKLFAAENMEVKMVNALAGIISAV